MARFKSEFLADYWQPYGTPLQAKMLGNVHTIAKLGSPHGAAGEPRDGIRADGCSMKRCSAIDRRRTLPQLSRTTLASRMRNKSAPDANVLLFNDTFTNYYDPEIGIAAWEVMEAAGLKIALAPEPLLRQTDDLERPASRSDHAGEP